MLVEEAANHEGKVRKKERPSTKTTRTQRISPFGKGGRKGDFYVGGDSRVVLCNISS